MTEQKSIIRKIADYLEQFIIFPDPDQSLVVAAWIAGTHCWEIFHAFAFLTITARTKRAGKSLLGIDLVRHLCNKGFAVVAPTPASILTRIEESHPTMIFDEAESMGSEAKNVMHSVMNSGYKRGLLIERKMGKELMTYDPYNPYIFILIGSTADTIRDRSIVVELARSLKTPSRRIEDDAEIAQAEMRELHNELRTIIGQNDTKIVQAYKDERAPYLVSSRDEEICRGILAVTRVIGTADDYEQLQRALTDASTAKSAPAITIDLDHEKLMAQAEYAQKLINDCLTLMQSKQKQYPVGITAAELMNELFAMPLAPWRKYLGVGLNANSLADLMRASGFDSGREVVTTPFRRPKESKVIRGYKWEHIERMKK